MKNILFKKIKFAKTLLTVLSLALIINNYNIFSAQGDLDTTFNPSGVGPTQPGTVFTAIGADNPFNQTLIKSLVIQSDGKIVGGGNATVSGNSQFALARYNTDGSLDSSFGSSGNVLTTIGSESYIFSIALQNDGKIVAGGSATIGGLQNFVLARYNTDGSLDSSFGTGGIANLLLGSQSYITSIAIQNDGKIVVGGTARFGIEYYFALARYNTDGTLDSSFGQSGSTLTAINDTATINSIALQSDGKIVAGGYSILSSIYYFALARYNVDGTLDSSFGQSGIATTLIGDNASINSIAIQVDDKIVAGGYASISSVSNFGLARYTANGTLDNSFGQNGTATTLIGQASDIRSVAMQNDGKIYVAGNAALIGVSSFGLARYTTTGLLDSSFGQNGIVTTVIDSGTNSAAYSVLIQPDSKVVAAGMFTDPSSAFRFALARYLAASTLILSDLTIALQAKYCNP